MAVVDEGTNLQLVQADEKIFDGLQKKPYLSTESAYKSFRIEIHVLGCASLATQADG